MLTVPECYFPVLHNVSQVYSSFSSFKAERHGRILWISAYIRKVPLSDPCLETRHSDRFFVIFVGPFKQML
jgi:hypothetical protein